MLQEAGIEDEVAPFITTEVDRLDQILSAYLAFGSETEAAAEDFDLATVLRRSLRLVSEELQNSGITLRVVEVLPASPLRGDPLRLQQVLLNLLLNARDAMSTGGVVDLNLAREGDDHVVTVSDEGTGLQGLDSEQIFAPFWTSKEKGSGLGLALSRQIVESFGGRLELNDRQDPVAGHALAVGQRQEAPPHQGRIEEVPPRPAEQFLAHQHAEGDAHGHHPQRQRRRQDEWEDQPRHQEPLVDLLLADDGEQHLHHAARRVGDHDHRQHAQAEEVQRHQRARRQGDDDRRHVPLHVEGVADVGGADGPRGGRVFALR